MAQQARTTLQDLIQRLQIIFSNGPVNVDEVKHLMESYVSKPSDWQKFAFYDEHKYTRNLIDRGNGKFNLILLCWSKASGSSVHDHSKSHCFMKILEGQLKETCYDWPSHSTEEEPLTATGTNYYDTNSVAYINDSIGLHRVENESHSDTATSLHLYSPPFDMCQSFDQRSGHSNKCCVTFYSEMGKKTLLPGKSCGSGSG